MTKRDSSYFCLLESFYAFACCITLNTKSLATTFSRSRTEFQSGIETFATSHSWNFFSRIIRSLNIFLLLFTRPKMFRQINQHILSHAYDELLGYSGMKSRFCVAKFNSYASDSSCKSFSRTNKNFLTFLLKVLLICFLKSSQESLCEVLLSC